MSLGVVPSWSPGLYNPVQPPRPPTRTFDPWTCVEDRIDNGTKLGKVIKKIIFGDIFADRTHLFKNRPMSFDLKLNLQVNFKIF